MQLSLLHVDGEWLVDNVIDIASAQDLGARPAPTADRTQHHHDIATPADRAGFDVESAGIAR